MSNGTQKFFFHKIETVQCFQFSSVIVGQIFYCFMRRRDRNEIKQFIFYRLLITLRRSDYYHFLIQ